MLAFVKSIFFMLVVRRSFKLATASQANANAYLTLFSGFTVAGVLEAAGWFIAVLAPFVLTFKLSPRLAGKLLKIFTKSAG